MLKTLGLRLVSRRFYSVAADVKKNTAPSIITDALASQSPQLVALHARLRLPKSFKLSTLARCLTCVQKNSEYPDNMGLSIFGKNLLSYHATEHLLVKYPRLPLNVLNSAINAAIGDRTLHILGKEWGIDVDNSSKIEDYISGGSEAARIGKLRFDNSEKVLEPDLVKLSGSTKTGMSTEMAMASAIKAIVGAYYASTKSLGDTKAFVDKYILSSKHIDIQSLFEFEQPTRELAVLCKRQGLEPVVTRLLSESGRVSKRPVFLVAVFSGTEKLGESFGASFREAKIRASVNALMGWYLYSPLDVQRPSDAGYRGADIQQIDHGVVIV